MTDIEQVCFVDTNIWIYAFLSGQELQKATKARHLIREQSSSIVISVQVINEVCSVLLKKKALPESDIRQLIQSFYDQYRVIALDKPVFLLASDLRVQLSVSYWDSLILASAINANIPIIYSEDLQHGQRILDQLLILNPLSE
jgi:predicted nucleic acid-binding protein